MAFAGYLIKAGGSGGTEIPLEYMKISSYSAEVQRVERENNRAITGLLHRDVAPRTHVEIGFETKALSNTSLAALNALIRNEMIDLTQRNIMIEYYEPETDSYRTASCYMPDVQFPIRKAESQTELIFEPVKYVFIEY
jgi:hypothetical protein